MGITVIIPHYGSDRLLQDCVAALSAHTDGEWSLVVHDNNQRNVGFAAGCNDGALRATGDLLVFINNDCFVHAGWLPPIVAAFDDPQVGIVGGRLFYADGRIQHAGVGLRIRNGMLEGFNRLEDHPSGFVPAVTGALMAVRRDCWIDLGGFDTGYVNGYEDLDLCIRARHAGWQVWFESNATATHLESQSGAARWTHVRENIARLQRWKEA